MRILICAAATALLAAFLTQATAQQPSPAPTGSPAPAAQPPSGGTPDKMPFDIPYGMSIGLEHAKKVMAAAEPKTIAFRTASGRMPGSGAKRSAGQTCLRRGRRGVLDRSSPCL